MGRNPIIPTLLLAFIGLASMSNNAKADVYLYRAYDYGYVKSYTSAGGI
jgi:hypothetical protein